MDSHQVDRLIELLERYVRVEEAKLQLAYQQLAVRNKLEERTTLALEKQADGLKFTGDIKTT